MAEEPLARISTPIAVHTIFKETSPEYSMYPTEVEKATKNVIRILLSSNAI
jgi:hypothetical protein